MAYAVGRYGQGISVAKALAQGLGSKVKNALETTIKLAPKHADAHIALVRPPSAQVLAELRARVAP